MSFDAGCFDAKRSTAVTIYGKNGFKIERVFNQNDDSTYAHFSFDYGENDIKRVVISPIGTEPAGFAVDNLTVSLRPEHQNVMNVGDVNIDNLVVGTKWAENTVTYSFLTATSAQHDYGTGPETFKTSKVRAETSQPFSAGQQAMTKDALAMWAGVSGLHFQEVSDTAGAPGMIRLGRADISAPADTFFPNHDGHAGDVRINLTEPTGQVAPGMYEFSEVVLHELGHALGLKHPHAAGGNGVRLAPLRDSLEFSVMSYRSYPGGPTGGAYSNPDGNFPQTPMMNDIAAIQYLYGANFMTNAGDTTYTFDPTKPKIFQTIWDGGGNDTYDASAYHVGVSINLIPGMWSVLDQSQLAVLDPDPMNTHLARASVFNARLYQGDQRSLIENAIGGTRSDKIVGNMANNSLMGGNGHDTLDGLAGNDTLKGQAGRDHLLGGSGADSLFGGGGNDNLEGGGGVDRLEGGNGNDVLNGGNGHDVIYGGAGRDTMSGGNGNDVFVFRAVSDSPDTAKGRSEIVDFVQGDDHVVLTGIDANTTLAGNQDFSFIGTAHFSGTPGELRFIEFASATIVLGDVDGDKIPDFGIKFDTPVHFMPSDFLL